MLVWLQMLNGETYLKAICTQSANISCASKENAEICRSDFRKWRSSEEFAIQNARDLASAYLSCKEQHHTTYTCRLQHVWRKYVIRKLNIYYTTCTRPTMTLAMLPIAATCLQDMLAFHIHSAFTGHLDCDWWDDQVYLVCWPLVGLFISARWKRSTRHLVDWELARETEALWGNLPQCHSTCHKSCMKCPGIKTRPPQYKNSN